MKHFERIGWINPEPILVELGRCADLWDSRSSRRNSEGTPHSGMSDIWLRYNPIERLANGRERFNDEHVPIWYPEAAALPAARDAAMRLHHMVGSEMLGGVLITRIPPGGRIDRHVDVGWHVEQYDKLYLSLRSSPGAEFWCQAPGELQAEKLEPNPGEVWLFDNRKPHWVVNNSPNDRVTLIICVRTPKFGRF